MSRKFFVDADFGGVARVVNLVDPSAAQDAATKAYVDSAVQGLNWKDSARVATQANVNLASPGASIDGISLTLGDRVLVRSQTADAENGIYIWNGAASAMTRAPDANTGAELEQATVTVEEGTSAGATYRQTEIDITLDTDDVSWTSFGTAAGAASESSAGILELATQAETDTGTDDARAVTPLKLATYSGGKKKHSANIGDGAATQYDVSHNFNTRDCLVSVYRNSSPWDDVVTDVERTDANTVRVRFASAPASNAYRVVIIA